MLLLATTIALVACGGGGGGGGGGGSQSDTAAPTGDASSGPPDAGGAPEDQPGAGGAPEDEPSAGGAAEDQAGAGGAPEDPPADDSGAEEPSLSISGAPPSTVPLNTIFSFTPEVTNPSDSPLTFEVADLPRWAALDPATGEIHGTPGNGDVGIYKNIKLTVSSTGESAALGPFTLEVVAMASGSVTLTWAPPMERTDGSPLPDLAGYKLYWGTDPDELSSSITLDNPGLTSYVIENLAPGRTWHFAAAAFDSAGVESNLSDVVKKTI